MRDLSLGCAAFVCVEAGVAAAQNGPSVRSGTVLPALTVDAPPARKPKPARRIDGRATVRPAQSRPQGETAPRRSQPAVAASIAAGYVASLSTTANKTGTPLIETPQSVSVVTRDQMDAQNVQTLTEALRYSAGVLPTTQAISQRYDSFSVRGFDATSTGLLRDGLRGATAQAWPKAEPYGLQQVEILRGPSSVLYGQNAPGGLVNLITKRPLEQPFHEVSLQGGSFDRLQGQFDLSGPADKNGELLYRLTGLVRDSKTQFDQIPDDKLFIAPAVTWRPNADTSLTFLSDYSYDKFGPPRAFIPLAGTLLSNRNGPLPRNQFLDEPSLTNDRTQYSIGYLFEHRFNDVLTVRSNFRYGHIDLMTNTASGLSLQADQRTLNRALYQFGIVGDSISADNHLQANWWLGSTEFVSLAGVDYRHSTEDYVLSSGKVSSIDIYNPVYGRMLGMPGAPSTSTWQTSDQVGAYAQQQIKFDRHWILSFGGRWDWSNTETLNRLKNVNTPQADDAFTYRAGLVYLGDSGLAPYVSYSTSFIPVLGTDLYGRPYVPTGGKQAEAGIKYQPAGWNSFMTMSAFDLRQTNVQTTDPNNSLNKVQTGEVTSRGIELQAVANPTPGVDLVVSYTYSDLKVTSSNNPVELGRRPTGLPANTASLWGDYTFQDGPLAGFGFGGGGRYVGLSYADTANTIAVPAYTLLDAAIHYDLGQFHPRFKGFRLAVNATNLTNKHYYSSCSSTSCNAGFDRSVIASLRYRW